MGVGEGAIEDKDVGRGCKKEIDDTSEEPIRFVQISELRQKRLQGLIHSNGMFAHHVIKYRLRPCRQMLSRDS